MKDGRFAALTLAVALLGGCAQLQWQDSGYEAVRWWARNEARRPGPRALPDAKLPDAATCAQERERLRVGTLWRRSA